MRSFYTKDKIQIQDLFGLTIVDDKQQNLVNAIPKFQDLLLIFLLEWFIIIYV